jgi:hypothetical protein
MIDTAKLHEAQQSVRAASKALRDTLSESGAVETLLLIPLIADAAKLEAAIRSLAQAVQEDKPE